MRYPIGGKAGISLFMGPSAEPISSGKAVRHRRWSIASVIGHAAVFGGGIRTLHRQLLQQRLRLFQVARVEALREPAVNRSQQFARLLHLALVAP